MEQDPILVNSFKNSAFTAVTHHINAYLSKSATSNGEKLLDISEEELEEEIDRLGKRLAFSFSKIVESYVSNNSKEEDSPPPPSLAEIKRMKIKEIKDLIEEYDIFLPEEGSGRVRNLIKRDYLAAIEVFFENDAPIRFYSHRKGKKGWQFSNFSAHPIRAYDKEWATSEHLFQALKFYPHDKKWFNSIASSDTPAKAKRMGNSRAHKLREDWEEVKDGAMLEVVRYKVSQHEDVRNALLETGNRVLMEAAPKDYYWGEGEDGSGKNMLGKILMKIREEL